MKPRLLQIGFLISMFAASAAGIQAQSAPGIWISAAELARRPTSGGAWDSLLSQANSTCATPNLADQEDAANVCILAKALVFARLGEEGYRSDVVSALRSIVNAGPYKGRALALGRELGAYVIAADVISLQAYDAVLDQQFREKIRELLTTPTSDGPSNLIDCHESRPNNWGTHCGGTRAAVAAYLGDTTELARVAQVFKGFLGDPSSHASFDYGELSWQCDATQPVGINPAGCTRDGHSIDGVLPDDQRRGGDFTWPPPQESYVYEALQGALLQATILHRAGYDVFNWENKALWRAFQWLHEQIAFVAEGDDTWQPHVVNYFYGTSFAAPIPSRPGKNLGWTDWVFDSAGPAPPAFSPPGGSYDTAQLVTLSHPTAEAALYYTTDGSAPTTSSAVYTEPVPITQPATLQAIAVISGLVESAVAGATYDFQARMPGFSPVPSTYLGPQSVAISATTSGSTLYYTTDGSTPSSSSSLYADPILVTQTTTVRAIAVLDGLAESDVASATYTLQAAAPTFSPAGGRYTTSQTVMLSSTAAGANIYYTLDGSTPTTSSTLYANDPIVVAAATTVKAISVADGFANSAVATASYTFQAATPAFSPRGGTYSAAQTVSLSSITPDAVIYYTLDGSTPTTSSIPYAEAIPVTQNATIKAIATVASWSNSSAATANYALKPATPDFSLQGKTYDSPQTVALSHAVPEAVLYYTLDGSTPTTSSIPYAEAIPVTQNATIKAIATVAGWSNSSTATETYTLRPAAPIFSVKGGTFSGPQTVSLTAAHADAVIYYTSDGSTPTTSSIQYAEPIPVVQNTTLRAIAAVPGWSNSSTASATYALKTATPGFSPGGGTYSDAQSVSLSCVMAEARIYYTTDGSTPTTSSLPYLGLIVVSEPTVLKAIAVAPGWSNSSTATATYALRAAAPTFSLVEGTYEGPLSITIGDAGPGATIYFTTDGSTPKSSSEIYAEPITVTSTTTIKAMAAGSGWAQSATASATYTILIEPPGTQEDSADGSGGGNSDPSVP
jgi:hypothetical protein